MTTSNKSPQWELRHVQQFRAHLATHLLAETTLDETRLVMTDMYLLNGKDRPEDLDVPPAEAWRRVLQRMDDDPNFLPG